MMYVIGDSNTLYLALDRERTLKTIDGSGPLEDVAHMSVKGKDVTLLYYSGYSAYKVSYEYLTERCKDLAVTDKTPIIFQFGAIDIRYHLPKYDNTKWLVNRYVDTCVRFCEQYGLKPIFIQPITCIEHLKYNLEFEDALRQECQSRGLGLVELFGSFSEREYPSEPEDEVCHFTYEKNAKLLELLVDLYA